jgi:endoglucanase
MASGGNNINAIRTSPNISAHVLYGAVVGGPLENDKFWDYRDDWVTNEVAIDYNAPLVALAAMMVSLDYPQVIASLKKR